MIECPRHPERRDRRAGRAICAVVALALACVVHTIEPPAAAAATTCTGGTQPAPGTEQFGSCKGLLPFPVIAEFLGSLLKPRQLPIPGALHAQLMEIMREGETTLFGEWFDMHTVFWAPAPSFIDCSFGFPGENRFVGDKFVFNAFMDFPVPFFGYTAGLVPINRYVGPIVDPGLEGDLSTGNLQDPGAAIASGSLGDTAHVRALVFYGFMAWVLEADLGFMKINDQPVWVDLIPGDWGFQIIEGDIGIEHLRFPGRTANGYCPWPAQNKIVVWVPATISWMDWAEIEIKSSPPVVFVPGDQTTSFSTPVYSLRCRGLKLAKSLVGVIPIYGGVAAEVAGSAVPYDLCADGARATYADFLALLESEGRVAKTTDDMVQVPSVFNSDPAGWLMCDEAAGGSWTPNAPLAHYLAGAAKSMGAGTIDVIAHSKAGVDMLHFMTSDWYGGAYDEGGLYIRNVATLGSPYHGTPLAAGYVSGRGGQPVPLGREGSGMPLDLTVNFWNGFWDNFFDMVTDEIVGTFSDVVTGESNILTGVLDLGLNLACNTATQIAAGAVRVEQDPEVETRLTQQRLDAGFKGTPPKWITFGANADEGGDDWINQTCTGWTDLIWRTLLGDTRRQNCVPSSDDIDMPFTPVTYAIVGTYYCDSWDGANGACDTWSEFRHNDGAVDVQSSRLSSAYQHTVLDPWSSHAGHSVGFPAWILATHADHSMLPRRRAPVIWPQIKAQWGPNVPRTQYP